MIRSALLLLLVTSTGGLWYVMPGAEGQAAVRTSALKLLGSSSLAPEPPAPVQTSLLPNSPALVPVITAPVHSRAMPITWNGIGRIEPTARVTVRARMDDTIVERHIHDGAEVAAGDLLFRLDDGELQAQIGRSEAALARDRGVHATA